MEMPSTPLYSGKGPKGSAWRTYLQGSEGKGALGGEMEVAREAKEQESTEPQVLREMEARGVTTSLWRDAFPVDWHMASRSENPRVGSIQLLFLQLFPPTQHPLPSQPRSWVPMPQPGL